MFNDISDSERNDGDPYADAGHAPESLGKGPVLCNRDVKIKTGDYQQCNQNRHRECPKVGACRKDQIGENQKHYGNKVGKSNNNRRLDRIFALFLPGW